ncbi:flavin reductase family protein [Microbacterium sp. NPDC096154]|uniref:flavin reductase family protein n=1 Tax=Microbacterium sp. NPDC096154 TaxID=3155549 RepID=UPI003317DC87
MTAEAPHTSGARLAFPELFGRYPATVCIVTTIDADGTPRGSTCTAVTSLTADPPTLLVSFMADSNTLRSVRSASSFAVNVMGRGGEQTMRALASKAVDKFDAVDWVVPEESVSGAPLFKRGVLAYADCTVHSETEIEDHVLVVGRIEGIHEGDASEALLYADRRTWYLSAEPRTAAA